MVALQNRVKATMNELSRFLFRELISDSLYSQIRGLMDIFKILSRNRTSLKEERGK